VGEPRSGRWSSKIPAAFFDGPVSSLIPDGWALAAAGYVTAIGLYLLGNFIVTLANTNNLSFRDVLESVFGRSFLVAAPALVSAMTLATRRRNEPRSDRAGLWLDAAITSCLPLGAIVVIGSVIGFFADFGEFSHSVSGALYLLLLHLAGATLGAVAVVWSLAELAPERRAA
jgi:hypothetical protein